MAGTNSWEALRQEVVVVMVSVQALPWSLELADVPLALSSKLRLLV